MDIDKLINEAEEFIEIGEYSKAKKIAKKLIRKGIEDGYNILTSIFHDQENIKKCISTLKKGLKKFPDAWFLWMRLGNYLSDLEDFEESMKAFEVSLSQKNADKDIININIAILLRRIGKFDEGLKVLNRVGTTHFQILKLGTKLSIWLGLKEFQKIIVSSIDDKDVLDLMENITDEASKSTITYLFAYAYWKTGNEESALNYIKESLKYNRSNSDTYSLLREINSDYSPENNYYNIMVNGKWITTDDEYSELNFLTTYFIVAQNLSAALDFIKQHESATINKDSLTIEESEILDFNREENPAGIYVTTGLGFYSE